jgi:hypothetical protein
MDERAGDEPADEAARRVAYARAGLKLSRLRAIQGFEHVLTHRRVRFSAYRARASGRLALDGYQAARWVAPAALGRLGLAAWTQRLLSQVKAAGPIEEKGSPAHG